MSRLPEGVNWEWVAEAAPIAIEAGRLLRGFFERGVVTEYKTDVDLVTEADRTSEKLLLDRLGAVFPEHGVFGEEGTRARLDAEYRWYVDPLDGTTNFAHGFPQYCVSMGLEHRPKGLADNADGELVAGLVYDPMRDELFAAEKGKGAYVNGRPMHGSKITRLGQALLGTGFPSRSRHQNPNVHFYHEFTMRSHGVRRAGSAALDLSYVAAGRLDGYWEFRLNPWDTAAGALLVTESGGSISRFDGSPFQLDSREVLATNNRLHDEVVSLFDDMFAGRNLETLPTVKAYADEQTAEAETR